MKTSPNLGNTLGRHLAEIHNERPCDDGYARKPLPGVDERNAVFDFGVNRRGAFELRYVDDAEF